MSTEKTTDLQEKETDTSLQENPSERFMKKVMSEFNGSVSGGLELSDYQKTLIQGYFIGIDRMLKTQEENRVRKNESNTDHKWDNDLPYTWKYINLEELALDVVHCARMGLDMMQKNHVSPIAFKNNKTKKYDITLMPGYNGIRYTAEKYALETPVDVTVELVYSNDFFKPIKKGFENKVESYVFEVKNPFDRGEIIGGFGYIQYSDPAKNKLVIMPIKDILKRKPEKASAEFWGGTKKIKEEKDWKEEKLEGWFDEMCLKTVKREVYSEKHIPRDPRKIDDDYKYMRMKEARFAEFEAQEEIRANANAQVVIIDEESGEAIDILTPASSAVAGDDLP